MSSTNLTDGKSKVCFFMISGRNYLKEGEKAGDASKVKPKDAKKVSTSLGISTMDISARNIAIDKQGHRGNGSKIQNIEGMSSKVERMERINAAKLNEKKVKSSNTKDKESNKLYEDR